MGSQRVGHDLVTKHNKSTREWRFYRETGETANGGATEDTQSVQRIAAKPRRPFTGSLMRKTVSSVENVEYDTLMRTAFSLRLSYKIQNRH